MSPQRTRGGVGRILAIEGRVWHSIALWPRTPRPDDRQRFGYGDQIRVLLVAVVVLAVVEGIVIDAVIGLVTDSMVWPIAVGAVHLYFLAWLLGLLASLRTRPHEIDRESIQLRDSIFGAYEVRREMIRSAQMHRTPHSSRSGMKVDAANRSALLAYGDANVRMELAGATICDVEVDYLDLTVDRPREFVTAVEELVSR